MAFTQNILYSHLKYRTATRFTGSARNSLLVARNLICCQLPDGRNSPSLELFINHN